MRLCLQIDSDFLGPLAQELEDMKKRLKEIDEEAGALRELQAKVEKEMGAVQGLSLSLFLLIPPCPPPSFISLSMCLRARALVSMEIGLFRASFYGAGSPLFRDASGC